MSGPASLLDFVADPQWVAWRNETRDGKVTKIPYCAAGRKAEADNPETWLPHCEAAAVADAIINGLGGGTGIELGPCGSRWIFGIDLDTCRDPATGAIAPWARAVIDRFGSYTEVSPSGTGVKVFGLIDPADVPEVRRIMDRVNGRQWKRTNGNDHPPAIELHISARFFTVTWEGLEDSPTELRTIPLADLQWLIEQAGPAFAGKANGKREEASHDDGDDIASILRRLNTAAKHSRLVETALRNASTLNGGSRSEGPLGLGSALKRSGWSYRDMKAALLACPATREWATEKLAEGERQFERIWNRATDEEHEETQAQEQKAEPPPECIDGNWWLARDLPRPVPVLGEVICASTRALLGGPTGVGKTHLAMAMAGAIATGRGFLHWFGPAKPLSVLYVDGEMARDLIQDRMRDLHRRLGNASLANLHMLCREDFPSMQGLNTPAGQAFILATVKRINPSVIFLDNRMALTVGDMKDEEVWTDTMPMVLELTRKRIAQIWLDHTGHDGNHIYGSKTKEWQMDVVMLLEEPAEQPDADISIKLRFTKTRRRRPETREDFNPGTVTLHKDEWSWVPAEPGTTGKASKGRPMSDETELMRRAINNLASDENVVLTVIQEGMRPVRAVARTVLQAYLITNGWLTETLDYKEECEDATSHLTQKGRDRIRNALTTLERQGICGFNRTSVWPI